MNIAHHAAFMRKKSQVSHQFSRAATSYDEAATIQQQALDVLIERLKQSQGEQQIPDIQGEWLDIGCGTGKAFDPLSNAGASKITGLDLSQGMLKVAALRANSNVSLVQADADELPVADHSLDGILSCLMLQWSQNTHHTLKEWARTLKAGGTMAIATLLPGTHDELALAWAKVDDHTHVNRFDSPGLLTSAFDEANLTIRKLHQTTLTERYSSLPELLRSLKAIGATNVNPGRQKGLMTRSTLRQLEQHYPRDKQGRLPLSYEVCWIIASGPENNTAETVSRPSSTTRIFSFADEQHK